MTEAILVQQVAHYLQRQYPNVIYRFDLAADLKLTIGQARRQKDLHPVRGYPDLLIAHPNNKYHGLFIELKREGEKIYLKNGSLSSSQHIQEQKRMLDRLCDLGYYADFSVGFDDTVELIHSYMNNKL